MARSPTPKPTQTNPYPGHNDSRSARGLPPRASRSQLDNTPIKPSREFEDEGESLAGIWNQVQADWKLEEERRRSNGFLSARLHENGHALTSNLDETRNRFSYPASSLPSQDTDFVNMFDAGWSRAASLSYHRQLYPHYLSCPPPSTLSSNHRIQQRGSPQTVYEDNLESVRYPPSSSPTPSGERSTQDRSDWSSASILPRDYSNYPIYRPYTGSPPDPSALKSRGLTRRPRVQKPHKRVSRLQGDVPKRTVDPEIPWETEMDRSVMSVRRSNRDGSGSSFSSRFVPPPTTTHPIITGDSDDGARHLGVSPSSHVDPETERPRSRIKVREEAGSASTNTYSIPKKEPHTMAIPSLMNCIGDSSSSLSPVSTLLDQHSVIREDLQHQGERPIAKCRTDPQILFRETAAFEDRKSYDCASPLQVSHSPAHVVPAKKGQQALFHELYQMLGPLADPGSDTLRSKMEIRRDEKSGEGVRAFEEQQSSPDTPRGSQGPAQTLHLDILLAQRVVRDAMREEGEGPGFSDQMCMLSASECGEETLDSNSNRSECELDRNNSTRSVFDWRYA